MSEFTESLGSRASTPLPATAHTPTQRRESLPLWKGPDRDGITFSLLSRFLCCRERFRLLVVEGLKPVPTFNHRIEYGTMWHLCEEAHSRGTGPLHQDRGQDQDRQGSEQQTWGELLTYCRELAKKFPHSATDINHWYNVCKAQFPHYLHYWNRASDNASYESLAREQVFSIPYALPSGRVVRLRGKFDGILLVHSNRPGSGTRGNASKSIWLKETKTKGDVDPEQIVQQLSFDLQTMLYLVALQQAGCHSLPIAGVLYNVVRRPLSGGRYSIVRHKPSKSKPQGESKNEYYARVSRIIQEDPAHFFMRWNVLITQNDIQCFKDSCLDPLLESLCDWWSLVSEDGGYIHPPSYRGLHWRMPYGVYNPTLEGNQSDLDNYLNTGSKVGLQQLEDSSQLFAELM